MHIMHKNKCIYLDITSIDYAHKSVYNIIKINKSSTKSLK